MSFQSMLAKLCKFISLVDIGKRTDFETEFSECSCGP